MKLRKHLFSTLMATVLAVTMLVSLVPAAFAAEGDTHITIIGTSDMHGNIWGYSYEDMKESTKDGMSRISTYVNGVRAENPNTILVDAGDTTQGTIMTDDLYSKGLGNHPVMAAMNYMKYDAWTLGNHEFNWGVDTLKKVMAESKAPVLSANVKNADGTLITGNAYTIVERGGIKIAIIGVTTPNIPRWDGTKKGISELKFDSLADGVAAAIKDIGDKADVIMVSSHAGLGAEYSADAADAAQAILDKCPEVDVLQLGHTHTTYVSTEGKPVGEAKNNASEVVRYDLTLDKDKNITASTVATVSMKDIVPDEGLRADATVKESHEKTVSFITDNVLGHASAKFQPENAIKGLPEGKLQDTAVMDLINTVQLEATGADVSAAALFKDTSDLPKGDLNYGNIFDIYKFPNVLYTVKVTGAELKAYMEWSAECYNQFVVGDVTISFNPAKPGYLYDMFAGVKYEINLSKPAGSRIENVTFKGAALKDDQTLTLVVNDYRFTGITAAKLISGDKVTETSASVRDMLVSYLAKNDPLTPKTDNNWKITGVDLQEKNADRATLISLVNAGQIAVSAKSLNLNEESTKALLAQAGNVKVDGTAYTAATLAPEGDTYYRLRDLAVALKGTAAAFNVAWNDGVVITKGGEYVFDVLSLTTDISAASAKTLSVTVDGVAVEIPAMFAADNYFVSAAGIAQILGVTASEVSGVATITTK